MRYTTSGQNHWFYFNFDRKNKEFCQLGNVFRVICYEFQFTNVASDTILIFLKEINLYAKIYTSQQQKRYKGLMLNMFYIEKKIGKNRII
jgi:hypothetical protein